MKTKETQGTPGEDHLDVYSGRSVLHVGNATSVFVEGAQSEPTRRRYGKIREAFRAGYLDMLLSEVESGKLDFSVLGKTDVALLTELVGGISENEGRAIVGLCFLQLAVKSIEPQQSIRLHKGASAGRGFSWVDGISMRTLDADYTSPFLRDKGLLSLNRYGVMMTRSLAENYPYSSLYKASVKGPLRQWITLVDAIESGATNPRMALCFLMSLLKNRSKVFAELADGAVVRAKTLPGLNFETVKNGFASFIDAATYSARALEVVMHGLMQALAEMGELGENKLSPLSQMRTANKKAGSIGDVELVNADGDVVEAWDAKYGKPYLWDELLELEEKLAVRQTLVRAGFVVDRKPDLRADILDRKSEIERETKTQIYLMSFDEWARFQSGNVSKSEKDDLARRWLIAVVESFGQKRPQQAPIDEPCESWLEGLVAWMASIQ